MNSKKAQTFMTDFMASVAIFGAILTLFLTMWNLGLQSQTSFNDEDMLETRAERTADFMSTTPGYPENWEETSETPRIPGFATSQNILSAKKLEAFNDFTYEQQLDLTQTWNFSLKLTNTETGNIVTYQGTSFDIGSEPLESANTVIPVTRQVAVNKSGEIEKAELKYVVWR